MKVLLVGEYNRTHHNIKKGLEHFGHTVMSIGFTDGFKKVNVDIALKHYFETGFLRVIRRIFYICFRLDLPGMHTRYQLHKIKHKLKDYDVVQFVNEAPFICERPTQLQLIKMFFKLNKNLFFLSCGTDFTSVSYAYNNILDYHILTPYFENKGQKKDYASALSYLTPQHKALHHYIVKHCNGIISNDLDYYIPLQNHPKHLGLIPHAINTDILEYQAPILNGKIIIFHGVNTYNYYKKGNDIFDEALQLIKLQFPNTIEIIRTENLPYKTYIKAFNKAHIVLDQIYAYDQGFNALEAMAKGKVVFTGAEEEWLNYYNVEKDTIAINALPDAKKIASKLSWLIKNPDEITKISKQGRDFVVKHHYYINCAKQYLKLWKAN